MCQDNVPNAELSSGREFVHVRHVALICLRIMTLVATRLLNLCDEFVYIALEVRPAVSGKEVDAFYFLLIRRWRRS
jgi:hypothetical protein